MTTFKDRVTRSKAKDSATVLPELACSTGVAKVAGGSDLLFAMALIASSRCTEPLGCNETTDGIQNFHYLEFI